VSTVRWDLKEVTPWRDINACPTNRNRIGGGHQGTFFAGIMAIEADKLIGQDISIFRNLAILDDRIIGIFL